MERFIRGEISVRCNTTDEIREFLHELASRYQQIRWRDSGEMSNYTPMINEPNRYVVFYCSYNILTLGWYSDILPEKLDGYVIDYRDLQCSSCEPVAIDDLVFILNEE